MSKKNNSFTPGPWVIGSDRTSILSDKTKIFDVSTGVEPLPVNARLIVAGPEMFEALEFINEYLTRNTLGKVELEHGVGTIVDAHLLKSKIKSVLEKI